MNRKSRWALKTIALALVAAFLSSDMAHVWAFDGAPAPLPAQGRLLANPSLFEVPADFCRVKEIHGGGKKLILHIQDAHCNPGGQENLSRTLEDVMPRYGVDLVLVEGGSRDVTLDAVRKTAPLAVWKKVARRFLGEGKIAGEEYLNLTSERPMKIVGIEDRPLYRRSVDAYAGLAGRRTEILERLKKLRLALGSIKARLYPEDLLVHERPASASDDPAALAWVADRVPDVKRYPQLSIYAAVREKEKTIDFDGANLELAALVERLRAGGDARVGGLVEKFGRARDSRSSQFALIQNIFNIAEEKRVPRAAYPQLVRYAEYLETFQSIDLDALMSETVEAEDAVYRAALAPRGADALTLRAVDRYAKLLETAYSIQMSAADFSFFLANEPDFATPDVLAWVNRKLVELGLPEEMVPADASLEEGRRSLEAFYASVSARDDAFVRNAERVMDRERKKVAVLISGGYHTPHLKRLFRERDWSYAVLAPVVTTETDQKKYEKILLESAVERPEGGWSTRHLLENARPAALAESGARLAEIIAAAAALTPNADKTRDSAPEKSGARLAGIPSGDDELHARLGTIGASPDRGKLNQVLIGLRSMQSAGIAPDAGSVGMQARFQGLVLNHAQEDMISGYLQGRVFAPAPASSSAPIPAPAAPVVSAPAPSQPVLPAMSPPSATRKADADWYVQRLRPVLDTAWQQTSVGQLAGGPFEAAVTRICREVDPAYSAAGFFAAGETVTYADFEVFVADKITDEFAAKHGIYIGAPSNRWRGTLHQRGRAPVVVLPLLSTSQKTTSAGFAVPEYSVLDEYDYLPNALASQDRFIVRAMVREGAGYRPKSVDAFGLNGIRQARTAWARRAMAQFKAQPWYWLAGYLTGPMATEEEAFQAYYQAVAGNEEIAHIEDVRFAREYYERRGQPRRTLVDVDIALAILRDDRDNFTRSRLLSIVDPMERMRYAVEIIELSALLRSLRGPGGAVKLINDIVDAPGRTVSSLNLLAQALGAEYGITALPALRDRIYRAMVQADPQGFNRDLEAKARAARIRYFWDAQPPVRQGARLAAEPDLLDEVTIVNKWALPADYRDDLRRVLSWIAPERRTALKFVFYPWWHPAGLFNVFIRSLFGYYDMTRVMVVLTPRRSSFRTTLVHEVVHALTMDRPAVIARLRTGVFAPDGHPNSGQALPSAYAAAGKWDPSDPATRDEYATELASQYVIFKQNIPADQYTKVVSAEKEEIVLREIFDVKDAADFGFDKTRGRGPGLWETGLRAWGITLTLFAAGAAFLTGYTALFAAILAAGAGLWSMMYFNEGGESARSRWSVAAAMGDVHLPFSAVSGVFNMFSPSAWRGSVPQPVYSSKEDRGKSRSFFVRRILPFLGFASAAAFVLLILSIYRGVRGVEALQAPSGEEVPPAVRPEEEPDEEFFHSETRNRSFIEVARLEGGKEKGKTRKASSVEASIEYPQIFPRDEKRPEKFVSAELVFPRGAVTWSNVDSIEVDVEYRPGFDPKGFPRIEFMLGGQLFVSAGDFRKLGPAARKDFEKPEERQPGAIPDRSYVSRGYASGTTHFEFDQKKARVVVRRRDFPDDLPMLFAPAVLREDPAFRPAMLDAEIGGGSLKVMEPFPGGRAKPLSIRITDVRIRLKKEIDLPDGARLSSRTADWEEGRAEAMRHASASLSELEGMLSIAHAQIPKISFTETALRRYWEGMKDGLEELLRTRRSAGARLSGGGYEALELSLRAVSEGKSHDIYRCMPGFRAEGEKAVQFLVAVLAGSGRSEDERVSAARILGLLGSVSAVARPELEKAVADPDAELRTQALYALSLIKFGDDIMVPIYIRALADDASRVRILAAFRLCHIDPKRAADAPLF